MYVGDCTFGNTLTQKYFFVCKAYASGRRLPNTLHVPSEFVLAHEDISSCALLKCFKPGLIWNTLICVCAPLDVLPLTYYPSSRISDFRWEHRLGPRTCVVQGKVVLLKCANNVTFMRVPCWYNLPSWRRRIMQKHNLCRVCVVLVLRCCVHGQVGSPVSAQLSYDSGGNKPKRYTVLKRHRSISPRHFAVSLRRKAVFSRKTPSKCTTWIC